MSSPERLAQDQPQYLEADRYQQERKNIEERKKYEEELRKYEEDQKKYEQEKAETEKLIQEYNVKTLLPRDERLVNVAVREKDTGKAVAVYTVSRGGRGAKMPDSVALQFGNMTPEELEKAKKNPNYYGSIDPEKYTEEAIVFQNQYYSREVEAGLPQIQRAETEARLVSLESEIKSSGAKNIIYHGGDYEKYNAMIQNRIIAAQNITTGGKDSAAVNYQADNKIKDAQGKTALQRELEAQQARLDAKRTLSPPEIWSQTRESARARAEGYSTTGVTLIDPATGKPLRQPQQMTREQATEYNMGIIGVQKPSVTQPSITPQTIILPETRTGKGTIQDPFKSMQPDRSKVSPYLGATYWAAPGTEKTFTTLSDAESFLQKGTQMRWTVGDRTFKTKESAEKYIARTQKTGESFIGYSPEGKPVQGAPQPVWIVENLNPVTKERFPTRTFKTEAEAIAYQKKFGKQDVIAPAGSLVYQYGEKPQTLIGGVLEKSIKELHDFSDISKDDLFWSDVKIRLRPVVGLAATTLGLIAEGKNLSDRLMSTPIQSWGDVLVNGTNSTETRPIKVPEFHSDIIIGGIIRAESPEQIAKASLEYMRRYGISTVLGESLLDIYGAKGIIQLGARGLKIGAKGVMYPIAGDVERQAGKEYVVLGKTIASETEEGYSFGKIKPTTKNIPPNVSYEVGQGSKQQMEFNIRLAEQLTKEGKMSKEQLELAKTLVSAQAKSRVAPTKIYFDTPPKTVVKGLSERQGPILIQSIKELQRGRDIPKEVEKLGQLGGSGAENRQLLPRLTKERQLVPEDYDFALTGEGLTQRAKIYAAKVAKDLNVVAEEGQEFVASGPRLTKVSLVEKGRETKIVEFLDNLDLVSGNKEAVQSGLLFGKGIKGKGIKDVTTGLRLERLPEQSVKRTTSFLTISDRPAFKQQAEKFRGNLVISEGENVVAPLLKRAEKDIIKTYYDYKTLAQNLQTVKVKNPIKMITNPKKGKELDIEAEKVKTLTQKINPKLDFEKLSQENDEFLQTQKFIETPRVDNIEKIAESSRVITPITNIPKITGGNIQEEKSPKIKSSEMDSSRITSPRSTSVFSRSVTSMRSSPISQRTVYSTTSKSPSLKSSKITSPSSKSPSIKPASPRYTSPSLKSSKITSPSSKSPSIKPASPRYTSPSLKSSKITSPSPKSPSIKPASPRRTPKTLTQPITNVLSPSPRKALVVLGLKSKTDKKRTKGKKSQDFLANTRLDRIEGFFKRQDIILGDVASARQLKKDIRFKEGKSKGLGFSGKKLRI